MVWRYRVHDQQIDLIHAQPRVPHRRLTGWDRQIRGAHIGFRMPPVSYSRTLDNELIGGVHHLHDVEVGNDSGRQVMTRSEYS
jgi:hypothetical protein